MTIRAEISRDVVLPRVGGRNEAEVRRLYENAPIGFAATVINGSILVGILRDWVEPSLLAAREAIGDERGTIEVRARRASRQEVLSMRGATDDAAPDSFVTLEVIDDGAGMTKATLEHIFDPFFSTKSRDRGLGMAIVLAIVNRHGGRIVVDSVPLRGTEVRLLLPEAKPAGDPRDPRRNP